MTTLLRSVEHDRRVGWLVTALVTAVAALLRLPALGRPPVLVFDETYYVKDAWTLLSLGYEARWPEDPNAAFEAGDVDTYLTEGAYVVHPPVGKWVIALGLRALGAGDPAGWRIASALAGVVAVLLIIRIARRLTGSMSLGATAGLLLAVDGAAIVHSRTALLDGILMVLLLAAFGALLLDRDLAHARLRAPGAGSLVGSWGPGLGLRPWRIVAGVLLGLAVGTKWSALFFVAVLGLLTVGWDAAARRRACMTAEEPADSPSSPDGTASAGIQDGATPPRDVPRGTRTLATGSRWWQVAVLRDGPAALVSTVGVAALVYIASWSSWLRSPDAYGRGWAEANPGAGVTWLPEGLRSLVQYHREMWGFHTSLTAEHGYAAHPAGWLLQLRPTSFFFREPEEPAQLVCGADRCAQAITSLGNPLIWWLGTAAVVACVWWVVRRRDGVALAALSGIVAGWLPWLAYAHRTIFTFYAIVVLPWLVLCLVHAIGRLVTWGQDTGRERAVRIALGTALLLVLAVSAFFWPLWTAHPIPFRQWQLRMWLPGWV